VQVTRGWAIGRRVVDIDDTINRSADNAGFQITP
jgi:hypothetical protein